MSTSMAEKNERQLADRIPVWNMRVSSWSW
jgi:hypothetical protein